ncbi:MAG: 4-hydroxyphenylpyruvate dioxygenase [Granulosicoccus sp.]
MVTTDNPIGTAGFEFIEFAHEEPAILAKLFETMGFVAVARHRSKAVTLYRQGDVNYLINAEPDSFASGFAKLHGPCACAMAWRVADAKKALAHAVSLGATPVELPRGEGELHIPGIKGIGGSHLYFVDKFKVNELSANTTIYDVDFNWLSESDPEHEGFGLHYIDHLTHNVHRGNMDLWTAFYSDMFGFREIRFFDIEGRHSGLFSRALTSPCGRIRIPINESRDDKGQIEEYLSAYQGEGIQHIACGCRNIHESIKLLRENGLQFMPAPPDSYYERVDERLPGHGESLSMLRKNGLLIDGEAAVDTLEGKGGITKVLLQVFSKTVVGPIFFEFIERKGDEGFGEGNFKALFESIEEDQIQRGVL